MNSIYYEISINNLESSESTYFFIDDENQAEKAADLIRFILAKDSATKWHVTLQEMHEFYVNGDVNKPMLESKTVEF
jgi:predicted cupin superfamily sugar epimerase